jgi:hypothetical protein
LFSRPSEWRWEGEGGWRGGGRERVGGEEVGGRGWVERRWEREWVEKRWEGESGCGVVVSW